MPALYSHTTRATGTVLTAAIYNGDHQNHIDNGIPAQLDDYSSNVSTMQTITDPGEVGTESLATSLAAELERIRFILKELKNSTQWYVSGYQALLDANGNALLKFTATASAVNQLTLTNTATGTDPLSAATGTDVNIGIRLQTKGTGAVRLQVGGNTDVIKTDTATPAAAETGFLALVNDGAVTSLRRVSVGAVDSGGAGFRLLRVPN